jgi:uncharacterized protein (TIGR00290 family)
MSRTKAWLSWSTGKDSAWSLHEVRVGGEFEIVRLLTTVNSEYHRVAMHAVREALLDAQVEALGLPVLKAPIPPHCVNAAYEQVMTAAMEQAKAEGVFHVVFGDLFLADIRAYREEKLAASGMTAVFPLWGRDTVVLAYEMVGAGLRAALTCVDPKQLSPAFAGRIFDPALLAELPAGVDPCGERGEFHTFAFAGPMFRRPIAVRIGETVERDGFVFADVLPAEAFPAGAGSS